QNSARDAANNGNTAAAQLSRTWVSDNTASQPTLLSPTNGSATNDNTPAFDCTDVIDPSTPVTYAVQYVAKGLTCDFTSATTQGGLSASPFTPAGSTGPDGTLC